MPHSASADHVETATRGIGGMAELSDGDGALAYGDSILVGERVRLRGLRDDDLPSLARLEMDPGVMVTLANSVAPPSEAAAKERIATWCANDKGDLGFAIETIDDPPILVGHIQLAVARRTIQQESGPTKRPGSSRKAAAATRSGTTADGMTR